MTWAILAQAIFFLAIALLAIVVTIYVFASSLLGRAIEAQRKLKADTEKQLTEDLEKAREHLRTLQQQGGGGNLGLEEAIKSLKDIKRQQRKSYKELQGYKVFTAQRGVVYPAGFFFTSIFLSAVAWGLGASGAKDFYIGHQAYLTAPFLYVLVTLALLLVGFGVGRLVTSVNWIQKVAITSEEAWLGKIIEGYKRAQVELEELHRPQLELRFDDPKPPIRLEKGRQMTLNFHISLLKGEIAREIIVMFAVRKGFEIDTQDKEWQKLAIVFGYPGYIGFENKISEPLLKRRTAHLHATIKAPNTLGKFDIIYGLVCEGFVDAPKEFEVEVIPSPVSSPKA